MIVICCIVFYFASDENLLSMIALTYMLPESRCKSNHETIIRYLQMVIFYFLLIHYKLLKL